MYWFLVQTLTAMFLTTVVYAKDFNELVKKDSLKIFSGIPNCINDCSILSPGSNKWMQCNIVECQDFESMESAQAPRINNMKDISLELYTDEKDHRKKLALRIGWSPADNVSLKKTFGYKIEISNGNGTYSACYNISSTMEYPNNSKDIYYNDCFGRVAGTHITPGTNITVNISTLPLWKPDPSYGTTTRIIQVPDCTNEKLLSLMECLGPGEQPTTKPCISESCSTNSYINDRVHHVNCTVSKYDFTSGNLIEKCDDVKKPNLGMPSAPVRVENEQEWYKYIDDKTGEIKLALNFSWMAAPDSTMERVHSFYLEILPETMSSTIFINKCYAIHTSLEVAKHSKARFYYDCYGRNRQMTVFPDQGYLVHIASRPIIFGAGISSMHFTINIPDCSDSRLADVTLCEERAREYMHAEVKDVNCSNRSIQLSYNISSENAQKVDIFFCRMLDDGSTNCDENIGSHLFNLEPAGTLYNISFPSNIDKNANFVALISGTEGNFMRSLHFSFANCTTRSSVTLLERTRIRIRVNEEPGGLPTTEPCISGSCSTKSHVNDEKHHVNCTLSKYNFRTYSMIEQCDKVNKTVVGTPSAPVHVTRKQEWYKYIDEITGEIKLALNFSWMPGQDSSIESLHSYYIEILQETVVSTVVVTKCYAIHTPLEFLKHTKAEFYYDCYGRDRGLIVSPGHQYHIHIQSQPRNANSHMQFSISVPDCHDNRLSDVTACQGKRKPYMRASVQAIYCGNNSIRFTYNVSSEEEGQKVDLFICEILDRSVNCDVTSAPHMFRLQLAGTLYNITFPSDMDKNTNLSIGLQRTPGEAIRRHVFFNFSKCIIEPQNITMIAIICAITAICIIVLLILICYFSRKCSITKDLLERCKRRPARETSVNVLYGPRCDSSSNQQTQDDAPAMPSNIRVFVVFMDDHELHKDVMHWFCAYLKQDLGLDVRVHIWQPAEVALNRISYMKTNIKLADKVIIICSEGTKHCMEKPEYDGDLFTPIVREVSHSAFMGKNPGKFLVGYFPYSNTKDIPELLHDQCLIYCSLFKLMKQFEQFYFRLVGIEQFQQGAIYRIDKIAFDRYFEPSLTTNGMKLKESIDRMVDFVEKNPTWYTDEQGSDVPIANIPPAPSLRVTNPNSQTHASILEDVSEQASIRHITAKPPPNVLDGYEQAAPAKQSNYPNLAKTQSSIVTKPIKVEPLRQVHDRRKSSRSSFVLSDTDNEMQSSLSHASNSMPDEEDYMCNRGRPYSADYTESTQPFFRAESFNDQDFITTDYETSLEYSRLDSNVTQVTTLGLSESQEVFAKSTENRDDDLLIQLSAFGPQPSPESGVFNLAVIEDGVEDFEDQFKTINLTKITETKK